MSPREQLAEYLAHRSTREIADALQGAFWNKGGPEAFVRRKRIAIRHSKEEARAMICAAMRTLRSATHRPPTLAAVARVIGYSDHTTVLYHLRQMRAEGVRI
jgi:hypothetical protein